MPRPPGSKNKKVKRRTVKYLNGIVKKSYENPLPEHVTKYVEQIITDSVPAPPKLSTKDSEYRDYLLAMYTIVRDNIEPMVPDKFPEDAVDSYKFTPAQLWTSVNAYMEITIRNGQPLTISGMAIFSGMNMSAFTRMRNSNIVHPSYSFIKRLGDFVEMYNELAAHKKMNPAGPIFILKNMGWKDKVEIEATSNPGALSEEERAAAQKRIQEFSEKV